MKTINKLFRWLGVVQLSLLWCVSAKGGSVTVVNNGTVTIRACGQGSDGHVRYHDFNGTFDDILGGADSIAPGQSKNIGNFTDGHTLEMQVRDSICSSATVYGASQVIVSGGNTFSVSVGGSFTNYIGKVCVRNNDSVCHLYQLYRLGVQQQLGLSVVLDPGREGCVTFQAADFADTQNYSLYTAECPRGIERQGTNSFWLGPDGQPINIQNTNAAPINFNPNIEPPLNPVTVVTPAPPVDYGNNTNNITGTNGPINFIGTGTNGLSSDIFAMGINAVFDAITKGNAANDSNLRTIHSDLFNLLGLTNGLASGNGGGTNIVDISGITNSIDRFHGDNTNLLGRILGVLGGTNTTDILAAGTNSTLATSLGTAASSQAQADIDAAIADLNGPGNIESDADADLMFEHNLPGGMALNIDFNPLHVPEVSTLFSVAKAFISWLLVAAYITKIVKEVWNVLMAIGTARPGGVPNLGSPFGAIGNALGVATVFVVAASIMVIWGVVLGVAFTHWADTSSLRATLNSNPLTGLPGSSLTLVSSFFPLDLMMGLVVAYLVFKLTLGKAMLIAIGSIKFLFGS